ncbi:PilZ domain-containing protein [Methylobacterium sp. J-076]|uniref:PilZ domain-containing protein n=1 Tax=Methylobacterium sp. J-076 TaxID=2836655 RepID=UPI001FB9B083|nr:PilZ domain-containing protein [Methylobacterium sp. J-076]MCJ2013692.1 pilus assembly protein PilZ [Methylobacterium sp. J-076]
MSDDRRGAYRRNAFTFGAIETAEGQVDCLVWDVNDTGALIEIETPLDLPKEVRVRLSPEAPFRGATVAWQREKRAGITFA